MPTLFNGCGFGPPFPFTETSSWTWVDHPVSGLRIMTLRSLKARFRFGSAPYALNLATSRNSPDRSTKSTRSPSRAPTACKHRVSGSLSLPSRGPFHLSLTVLFSIGRWVVFSLAGWSPLLPTGFHVPRGTLVLPHPPRLSPTGLSPSTAGLSSSLPLGPAVCHGSPDPAMLAWRFGLLPVRSPLLGESMFLSFPPAT